MADSLNLTPHQLRNLVVAGFKGSFFPGSYRREARLRPQGHRPLRGAGEEPCSARPGAPEPRPVPLFFLS